MASRPVRKLATPWRATASNGGCAEVIPKHAAPNHDYVLIGRKATLRRPYADLLSDLLVALRRTESLAPGGGEQARP